MPQWLCNQLLHAYQTKNLKQLRLLNECWFFYRTLFQEDFETNSSETTSEQGSM